MSENEDFSVTKLPTYTLEEIAHHHVVKIERARKLYELGASYNARVRESLDKQEGLGAAQRWSDLRDIANEMADEAKKKAFACEVEYNLRTGIET